jgi:hypothetical protein
VGPAGLELPRGFVIEIGEDTSRCTNSLQEVFAGDAERDSERRGACAMQAYWHPS